MTRLENKLNFVTDKYSFICEGNPVYLQNRRKCVYVTNVTRAHCTYLEGVICVKNNGNPDTQVIILTTLFNNYNEKAKR